MRDIWNPWHGCVKYSEGCVHCYMYFLDRVRAEKDGSEIYKTKTGFNYPISKDRAGNYKVPSGAMLRVCMTSDFFMPEADAWRDEAWAMIKARPDVRFWLLTKRAPYIPSRLPSDWGDGYDNVMLNVTCENQRCADERIPILLDIPAKHKGLCIAPFIGPVRIGKYLEMADGSIEQVSCGGENYDGARPLRYEWVESLRYDCALHGVTFCFYETGTVFEKGYSRYNIPSKMDQSVLAYMAHLNVEGPPVEWKLKNPDGSDLLEDQLYKPFYIGRCKTCGNRIVCQGCSNCGKCGGERMR